MEVELCRPWRRQWTEVGALLSATPALPTRTVRYTRASISQRHPAFYPPYVSLHSPSAATMPHPETIRTRRHVMPSRRSEVKEERARGWRTH